MNPDPDRLVRHLALAIALKLILLVWIWWAFVKDARTDVNVDDAASHLTTLAESPPLPKASHGAYP